MATKETNEIGIPLHFIVYVIANQPIPKHTEIEVFPINGHIQAIEKAGINSQTKVSVDEDFNGLLLFDANIDGIISKNEIGNEMTTQWVGNGKDITMLRWLLWIAEGMQDEEKNKKQKQTIDSENLRRKLTENLHSLPNTQNGGKLAEVLQNLKNSLK
jgi:hypothetical protein